MLKAIPASERLKVSTAELELQDSKIPPFRVIRPALRLSVQPVVNCPADTFMPPVTEMLELAPAEPVKVPPEIVMLPVTVRLLLLLVPRVTVPLEFAEPFT